MCFAKDTHIIINVITQCRTKNRSRILERTGRGSIMSYWMVFVYNCLCLLWKKIAFQNCIDWILNWNHNPHKVINGFVMLTLLLYSKGSRRFDAPFFCGHLPYLDKLYRFNKNKFDYVFYRLSGLKFVLQFIYEMYLKP